MTNLLASLLLILAGGAAHASLVAVVDSGSDFHQQQLQAHAWFNPGEIAGNLVDDDHDGKVDDVNGWNFADGRGDVFFPEHLNEINPIAYKMIEVIAHEQAGTLTPDEKEYWKTHITALTKDQKVQLQNFLEYFGTYAHSTHCTGIVAMQNPAAKIMSARVFPDEPPDAYTPVVNGVVTPYGIIDGITNAAYKVLAAVSNSLFQQVSSYLAEKHVDVANYSLGMSLQTFAKASLALQGIKTPTPAQLSAETQKVFAQYEPVGKAWMQASPGTLFVVAAGNDGTDNDAMPAFPANIRLDNEITVAAIYADGRIATFSNYGKTTVDVAAPGVAVISTVPSLGDDNRTLPMSGTSMAAPYVTGVASRIKDANPKLMPKDIRAILMGTVDVKAALKGKVIAGGIVNPDRAAQAARNAKTMALNDAINSSRTQVPDRALPPPPPASTPKSLDAPMLDEAAMRLVF